MTKERNDERKTRESIEVKLSPISRQLVATSKQLKELDAGSACSCL